MRPKYKVFWMWLRQDQTQFVKVKSLLDIIPCCIQQCDRTKARKKFLIWGYYLD